MSLSRPLWLPKTGPGNLNVPPEKWGMKIRQWTAFIMQCALHDDKLSELRDSTDRGKKEGVVNLYQICDTFVKPWTRNTGNSIALLMNNVPLLAELMISHAWGEDMFEALVAILSKASVSGITLDTVLWFCTFAQYQPGDMEGDCGPGVAAQLALDPFKSVIASKPAFGMLVIHTSAADLYDRLWCVYEVNEAEINGVLPVSAYSLAAFQALMEALEKSEEELKNMIQVHSADALCFSEADKAMITKKIEDSGMGFDGLDEKIVDFRKASVMALMSGARQFSIWAGGEDADNVEQVIQQFDKLKDCARGAAIFVAMHCLIPFLKQANDATAFKEKLYPAAKGIISEWKGAFEEWSSADGPPPGFDESKVEGDGQGELMEEGADADDEDYMEKVGAALMDLNKFMFPVAMLEMVSGGSPLALVVKEFKTDGEDEDAFCEKWGVGDGKTMSKTDFAEQMRRVYEDTKFEIEEHDINILFAAADKNRDGAIDKEEFGLFFQRVLVTEVDSDDD